MLIPEVVYRQLIREADTLRPEDTQMLVGMLALSTPSLGAAVREYYRDGDRSDRTPRPILYFHLGWLAAAVMEPEWT